MMWYHVAEPSSYLAITGAGIDGVIVKKKAMVMPMQKVTKFSITPFDFSLSLQAMTVEKLNFSLPAVFTIGPDNSPEALCKYAILLTGNRDGTTSTTLKAAIGVAQGRDHVQSIVKGVIEGETRSIVSTMTMEELFQNRKMFRDNVIKNVQSELDQFGLKIYNANVKELQDTPGSEYFAYLSRKAHEGASNQAKVDVAEARAKGEIGEAERQGRAKQEIAKIHADTAVKETQRKAEKALADAELTQKEIEIGRKIQIDKIEAQRMAEERDTELQRKVELKRAEMELERQRASHVVKAVIARESEQQKADGQLYTQERNAEALKAQQQAEADAANYRQTKDAEAQLLTVQYHAKGHLEQEIKKGEANKATVQLRAEAEQYSAKKRAEADKVSQGLKAEASLYTAQKDATAMYERSKLAAEAVKVEADAAYYAKKQQAAGLTEMAKAYGSMADVLGGPQGLMQWMMLERGIYEKLAAENAKAIQGLQPKINVWNTGSGDGMDSTAPIRNLFQSLPPLFEGIQQQTGMTPPSWMVNMPKQEQKPVGAVKGATVNGKS